MRCFVRDDSDFDDAVEALADAGLVEQYDRDLMRAMAMRETTKTSAAIVTVADVLQSLDGNHEWTADERWLSIDGDYEAALTALRLAGFHQLECPPSEVA